ncbi:MAG: hypothetical protein IJT36_06575 [Alphaproteobacteria bacterium]|nr:hypothetical protein [Alphaproteobacteria bacterium]
MFFALDHYRFYELRSKIKASTYLAASMLQQVTNLRSEKNLTINDLRRITATSCMNLFHTNAAYEPWPFGIYFSLDLYWAKRIGDDRYIFQHSWAQTTNGRSPNTIGKSGNISTTTYTEAQIKAIHKDLICEKNNEERVLITCCYRKANGYNKKKLGLYILEPKSYNKMNRAGTVFMYELVITPKPGLFPVVN